MMRKTIMIVCIYIFCFQVEGRSQFYLRLFAYFDFMIIMKSFVKLVLELLCNLSVCFFCAMYTEVIIQLDMLF